MGVGLLTSVEAIFAARAIFWVADSLGYVHAQPSECRSDLISDLPGELDGSGRFGFSYFLVLYGIACADGIGAQLVRFLQFFRPIGMVSAQFQEDRYVVRIREIDAAIYEKTL